MVGGELVGIGRLAQLHDFLKFCGAQIEEIALKFRIEHDDSFRVNWLIDPARFDWITRRAKATAGPSAPLRCTPGRSG
jgi:hypothetical protein